MNTLKRKIVIIDDDQMLTALIHKLLENDFETFIFNDPMVGIERCAEILPVAVLLDVNMPSIDGVEVIKHLRRNPQTAHLPIICISGDGDTQAREQLDEYGAVGFIKKPIDIEHFRDLMLQYLSIINKNIISEDKRIRCCLTHSVSEKYRIMDDEIEDRLRAGESLMVVSWRTGSEIGHSRFDAHILSEQLVWLEIKPLANIKMPYLTNLMPIIDDIQHLLGKESTSYVLYFDDLKNLFNLQDKQRSISKTTELAHLFKLAFRECHHFFSKPTFKDEQDTVNRMIQQLIGRGA